MNAQSANIESRQLKEAAKRREVGDEEQVPARKMRLDMERIRRMAIEHIGRIRGIGPEDAEAIVDRWAQNNPQPDDAPRSRGREDHKASSKDAEDHAKLVMANRGVHPGYLSRIPAPSIRESSDNKEVPEWAR